MHLSVSLLLLECKTESCEHVNLLGDYETLQTPLTELILLHVDWRDFLYHAHRGAYTFKVLEKFAHMHSVCGQTCPLSPITCTAGSSHCEVYCHLHCTYIWCQCCCAALSYQCVSTSMFVCLCCCSCFYVCVALLTLDLRMIAASLLVFDCSTADS